jgi:hypothetical protein
MSPKKGSTGNTGGGSRVGSPPMSPAGQRNRELKSRAASRRNLLQLQGASRLMLSKQSQRRKMAAKLSALKLPAVAVVDPDDPLYEGAATTAAIGIVGAAGFVGAASSDERSASMSTSVDIHAFTTENESGGTVIDVSGFEHQHVEVEPRRLSQEPTLLFAPTIASFEHWFENLSIASSSLSSLWSFDVISDNSGSNVNSDELSAWLQNSDSSSVSPVSSFGSFTFGSSSSDSSLLSSNSTLDSDEWPDGVDWKAAVSALLADFIVSSSSSSSDGEHKFDSDSFSFASSTDSSQ